MTGASGKRFDHIAILRGADGRIIGVLLCLLGRAVFHGVLRLLPLFNTLHRRAVQAGNGFLELVVGDYRSARVALLRGGRTIARGRWRHLCRLILCISRGRRDQHPQQ